MQIKEILKAVNGELLQGNINLIINSFSNDTRTLEKGALYIPIIGENFDGHSFIEQAYNKGAVAILSSQKEGFPKGLTVIYVPDTLKALQSLAHYKRITAKVKVIAITGSVGKTSTKDMVASVVSTKYKTLKTLGNYNNNIGLPLTILRLKDEEVMVLEMGMNHLSEISLLSTIAKPDIAIITNVGSAHIGNLGSRENILKAKLEICDGLVKDGVLIINGDNDLLSDYFYSKKQKPAQVIRYGLKKEHNDVFPTKVKLSPKESQFEYNNQNYNVSMPGAHFISNALACVSIGLVLKIPLSKIKIGIESFELTKNRNDTIELNKGITLIDGTYNANADSMKASLLVLSQFKNQRKVAVLADMFELGTFTTVLHEEVGKYAEEVGVDFLICIGELSKSILKGGKNIKETYWFPNNQEATDFLLNNLKENDVILMKGSNTMKLKEIVEVIKEKI